VKEEWKDIGKYQGFYQISNLARVKSTERKVSSKKGTRLVRERIMKQSTSNGYKRVTLNIDGKGKGFLVHRLLATAFIPIIKGKNFINHKNCIKSDNRIDNIEWCTVSENTKHAFDNGLIVSPCKRLDDIHFLTYATCLAKFKEDKLKSIMTFTNFRYTVRGTFNKHLSGLLKLHMEWLWSERKLKTTRKEALAKIRGEQKDTDNE